MDLLLTLDENYLLPCRVMLDSFFTSNPGEENVSVYLLHSGIPAGKLEELAGFCSGFGAELKPMIVDTALFENAPTSKRYPKEMYYRLLSPLILPQKLERVLYLDPDMLIINPLRPLWELDLHGKTFAAASHTGLTEMANEINQVRLDTEHEYFNSGVMLIDLTAARKLVTAEDVFRCVSQHEGTDPAGPGCVQHALRQGDAAHRRCGLELRRAELLQVPDSQQRQTRSELGHAEHGGPALLRKEQALERGLQESLRDAVPALYESDHAEAA